MHNSYLSAVLAIKICIYVNLLRRRRNECIYSIPDTSSYLAVGKINLYMFYLYAQKKNNNSKLSFQYWHQPFVIIVYKKWFTLQQLKNGKKSMYLEYYLNIDVRVNALHDPLFWFYIWRSPLIAQNKHVALTTVFRLRRKQKQDCPATIQCWFAKDDLKTLLQLAVVHKHWLVVEQMWGDVASVSVSVFIYEQVVRLSSSFGLLLEQKEILHIKGNS